VPRRNPSTDEIDTFCFLDDYFRDIYHLEEEGEIASPRRATGNGVYLTRHDRQMSFPMMHSRADSASRLNPMGRPSIEEGDRPGARGERDRGCMSDGLNPFGIPTVNGQDTDAPGCI
jgi:hypothetical protein